MKPPAPMETQPCGAKTRGGGECRKQAGWGTEHVGAGRCRLHGGNTPDGAKHGSRELAMQAAQVMGVPRDVDPHEAILECIARAAGHVDYATSKIAELDDPMVNTMFGPKLNEWIHVQQQSMDRLVTYSKIALAAGVEERRVRLAEQQGQLIAEVIRGVLTALGVDQHPEAPRVVRRHLQLVSGAAAA
jgi:hypothetical protein